MSTLTETVAALRTGQLSCTDLVEAALENGDLADNRFGIFVTRFPNTARQAARGCDALRATGNALPPLFGIPIAVKDVIDSVEAPTSGQSRARLSDPAQPAAARADAASVRRLRRAGAVIVGKTTAMEFGIGMPDPASGFPTPRNPWNPERWSGGSSSGSASAVAVSAAMGSLGTDTGGSVRIPAAYCGVTGFIATFGAVPTQGCIPIAPTVDRVGVLAGSVDDCIVLTGVLTEQPAGSPAASGPSSSRSPSEPPLLGLRIGVDRLTRYSSAQADPRLDAAFGEALTAFADLGAELVEVSLPLYDEMVFARAVVASCESFAFHRAHLQRSWTDYGAGTRTRLAAGALYAAVDYLAAQRVRRIGSEELSRLFHSVDLVLTPTSCATATPLAQTAGLADAFGVDPHASPFAAYWNASSSPALTVPMGFGADGMPLGLHLAAAPSRDETVLQAGAAYQRATDWHRRRPNLSYQPIELL